MKTWKRNKKDLKSIIREDLGNDFEKWRYFFQKDPDLALECFDTNIKKWSVDELILIYYHLSENVKESANGKKLLSEIERRAGEIVERREEAGKILKPDVLENCEWYWEEKSKDNRRKLLAGTIILTLLVTVLGYVINLNWNGMQWISWSSSMIIASSFLLILCTLLEVSGHYRVIGWPFVFSLIIAIGTVGSLGGILWVPSAMWIGVYAAFLVIFLIYCLANKKRRCRYAKFTTFVLRGGLYFIPVVCTVLLGVHYRSDLANYLNFARQCHNWAWHQQEEGYLINWRRSEQYNNLHKALKDATQLNNFNKDKIEKACKELEEKDPDRQCRKDVEAPWKKEFKAWLEQEAKSAINGPKNEESCEKICSYMGYYRDKFHKNPVDFETVMEKLFQPELKKYEKGLLKKICDQMDRFVTSSATNDNLNSLNNLRNKELQYALIPALEEVFRDIKSRKDDADDPISDALHLKFKELAAVCKKHHAGKKIKVLVDYARFAEERNRNNCEMVGKAVAEYINKSDSSAWQQCKGGIIEEFSKQIPGACYVLWKFGHPSVDNGKKQNPRWLAYLEKDQAGKIAESSYYTAEIYLEKQNKPDALKYFKQALTHGEGKKYPWENSVRHNIVVLSENKEEKWQNLWKLYQARDIKDRECLEFARMCLEHDKRDTALEIYGRCPETSLEIDDLFAIVDLNKGKQQKQRIAFEKLSEKLKKDIKNMDKRSIERFYNLGTAIFASDIVYDFLRDAVVQGNNNAQEFYINAAKKQKKLDIDAVSMLIRNKKLDKQVIELAKLTNNESVFISEAKRWQKEKYKGYQQYIIDAGRILYAKKEYEEAWKLWRTLDNKALAQVGKEYCSVLDGRKNLSDKDMEFLAEYSLKIRDSKRLVKLAEHFDNKKEWSRAVYFWAEAVKSNPGDGKGYFRLYKIANDNQKDKSSSSQYSFDEKAEQVYARMTDKKSKKENLYNAVFEHQYKEAVLALIDIAEFAYSLEEIAPNPREVKRLKGICKELIKKGNLTPEERGIMEEYSKK